MSGTPAVLRSRRGGHVTRPALASFIQSEIRPHTTMATSAQPYGIIVSTPTIMLLFWPSDLMICGMKISMPRLAVTMPR